ncbi:MAG: DUF349 domain-containing protein [Bacteroidales bacterium]|nr:DUF349 domain-containing protein [Bacteroidales bacterium]
METKDQSKNVDQNIDVQDSTTATEAGTKSTETSEKLDITVEVKAEEIKKDDVVIEETPISEIASVEEQKKEVESENEVKEVISDETIKETPAEVNDESTASSEEDATDKKSSEEKIVPDSEKNVVEDYSEMGMENLVSRLVELVNETDDILSVKDKVATIKVNYIRRIKEHKQEIFDKFIKDGGVEEEYKSIELAFENSYKEAFKIYKDKRGVLLKKLEAEKEINLEKKESLLEKLRIMIKSEESLKKTYDEFKILQVQWREIGMIPQGKVKNLWENYHFLVDQFFDKVKISHELRDLDSRKNLERKIELSEKVEELLLEKSINKSFTKLQELHDKWREIGSVPMEKKDEIWERFKAATDKINQRRHDYYEKLHEDQNNNLILKTALCEKMDELVGIERASIKEWNSSTDSINALFAEWKTLGPTPKKHNDEIWSRFKTSMNQFFENRKNYFKTISDEQMNNYNLKLDICRQAEAAKESTDWKDTSNELIKLQKQWKEIGGVPRKYSDKIWKRFRSACDHFFEAKSEYFKNIGDVEEGNLKLKKELIEKIKSYKFGEVKEENLNVIKSFQKKWSDIGRVPFKELNRIQKEFRKHIDKCLDDLNIDNFEFQNMNLKSKIEGMKNKGDAKKTILREMNFLKTKIDKIKADVILWETNMGFFANSKNADLLKQEFEKKINRAKKEMDTFKAKIRQMDKMKRGLDEPVKEEKPTEEA